MTHVTRNLGAVGVQSRGQGVAVVVPRSARHAMRAHARTRASLRQVLIGGLMVVTVATGALLLLRGGSDTAAGGGFGGSHERVVAAASQVPAAAVDVQRERELDAFNQRINALISEMWLSHDTFKSLARGSEGQPRVIARAATATTLKAIHATDDFRKAIAFSNRLAEADKAQGRLDVAVAALDRQAAAWKKA